MFALLQRALNEGALTLGKAQQHYAAADALGAATPPWRPVAPADAAMPSAELPLHAGVVQSGDRIVALNRPPSEDIPATLTPEALNELFAGLDFRVLTGTLENSRSLTNEVWRTFLLFMALALLGEALLCMPPRRRKLSRKNEPGQRLPPAVHRDGRRPHEAGEPIARSFRTRSSRARWRCRRPSSSVMAALAFLAWNGGADCRSGRPGWLEALRVLIAIGHRR